MRTRPRSVPAGEATFETLLDEPLVDGLVADVPVPPEGLALDGAGLDGAGLDGAGADGDVPTGVGRAPSGLESQAASSRHPSTPTSHDRTAR